MDSKNQGQKKWNIILGATGSVASIKLLELAQKIQNWAQIKIVLTQSSKNFIDLSSFKEMAIEVYCDQDQNKLWSKRGDPVLHIQLRKWADAIVIAPLSANTLAKIANGLCDNLLTLICRSWDMQQFKINSSKGTPNNEVQTTISLKNPFIICPAMNTMMWSHPVTSEHIRKLQSWAITIVPPIEKMLMCGDSGIGAMNQLQKIIEYIKEALLRSQSIGLHN